MAKKPKIPPSGPLVQDPEKEGLHIQLEELKRRKDAQVQIAEAIDDRIKELEKALNDG